MTAGTTETAQLVFLTAAEVDRLFDLPTAIDSQRAAFRALGQGTAVLPDKLTMPSPTDDSVVLCYTARLGPEQDAVTKIVSAYPGNEQTGLPTISAMIVVLDARTGQPTAIMDGTIITTRRTAAASAVAVDLLSPADTTELAVIGTGVQGREHVRALTRVRPIRTVRVWDRLADRAATAARQLAAETGLDVQVSAGPKEAVAGAQVIALCTLSTEPVLDASWLSTGATVVSIGSFEPDRREVGPDVVGGAARVVVDDPATSASHAGPIVQALRTGLLHTDRLVGLGAILVGAAPGRTGTDELIYYNSTGVGVQDAAAAHAVLDRARRDGLGRRLPL